MKNPLAVLDGLKRFDTATVCNVLEITGLRSKTEGYADARIKALFPRLPPMVGFAVTAAFRACEPTKGVPVYQSLVDQVAAFKDLPGPAVAVFQDLDDPQPPPHSARSCVPPMSLSKQQGWLPPGVLGIFPRWNG